MNGILIPVILVAAIGLIAGLGLSVASIVFAVPKDEKAEAIREVLPGANCGACGYSGCDGYAAALSKGETDVCNKCTPGGNDVAQQVAQIMGLEAGSVTPQVAAVMCCGNSGNVDTKLEYSGVRSCKIATQLFGCEADNQRREDEAQDIAARSPQQHAEAAAETCEYRRPHRSQQNVAQHRPHPVPQAEYSRNPEYLTFTSEADGTYSIQLKNIGHIENR